MENYIGRTKQKKNKFGIRLVTNKFYLSCEIDKMIILKIERNIIVISGVT